MSRNCGRSSVVWAAAPSATCSGPSGTGTFTFGGRGRNSHGRDNARAPREPRQDGEPPDRTARGALHRLLVAQLVDGSVVAGGIWPGRCELRRPHLVRGRIFSLDARGDPGPNRA